MRSFPSSKALQRYSVRFSYIENAPIDSRTFADSFDLFIRAALVVKKVRNLRVGVMNLRPKPFLCVMFNEAELLEQFGIEVVPLSAVDMIARVDALVANHRADVDSVVREISGSVDISATEPVDMRKLAALRLAMLESAQAHNLDAIGSECWTAFPQSLGIVPCAAFGDITNCGLPISCETDVMGAISMAMLQAAARSAHRPFCADLTMRHPDNDNAELLWHCGPFPASGAKPGAQLRIVDCKGHWEMKHGPMTVARLDGLNGAYRLLAGEGRAVAGPPTNGTYSWFEVADWPAFERKVIEGPYIHHVAGIHGHWADVLQEAARYLRVGLDHP